MGLKPHTSGRILSGFLQTVLSKAPDQLGRMNGRLLWRFR